MHRDALSVWRRMFRSILAAAILGAVWASCNNFQRQPRASVRKVAVIGAGVSGLSSATAIREADPSAEITVFYDRPWEQTLSRGIAGLFRVDEYKHRAWANATFTRLAGLWRRHGGRSGVQLISGHIVSNNHSILDSQDRNMNDIVYNFRWLSERETDSQFGGFEDGSKAIHYTAFTSEGAKYCPFMRQQLEREGVRFEHRKVESVEELGNEGYDVVVNAAGLHGGELAGDGDAVNMYPIRGVLLKVDAPWQKHFLYRNFDTITIPTIDAVYVGTVKQVGDSEGEMKTGEQAEVWRRYTKLQPAFDGVNVLSTFVGLRPGRSHVRVEADERTSRTGRKYKVVHNYGHGGSGFTLSWGCATEAARLAVGGVGNELKAKM